MANGLEKIPFAGVSKYLLAAGYFHPLFIPSVGIGCGKPPFLKNGYIKYKSTSVRSKAYHFCNKGYRLKGDHVRVCQYNGYWSGSTQCVPIYY